MNRNDLIADIAVRTGQTKKDISDIIAAYEDAVIAAIGRGENVFLHKFMRIERKMKNKHSGFDFKNKKSIIVPEQERIEIRPGTALTDCL